MKVKQFRFKRLVVSVLILPLLVIDLSPHVLNKESNIASAQILPLPIPSSTVTLTPIQPGLTAAQIQTIINTNRNVYFMPGTHNIGTLVVNGWVGGTIWGAGRMGTTSLNGNIVFSNSTNVTFGNLNVNSSGGSAIRTTGTGNASIKIISVGANAGPTGTAINIQAPGEVIVQGTTGNGNDIGIDINNPNALVYVVGGNYAQNRIHIRQQFGHLDARSIGFQQVSGNEDIQIMQPSPLGHHVIDGIRTEGSSAPGAYTPQLAFLRVPSTTDAVNVVLRGATLAGVIRYADFNANGTLGLVGNTHYFGSSNWTNIPSPVTGSTPAGTGRLLSWGNRLGLSYMPGVNPFNVNTLNVTSMGDLWQLNNPGDYSAHFNEPITQASMQAAGKTPPAKITFIKKLSDTSSADIPVVPPIKIATVPTITNLGSLMTNVTSYGAIPNDGIDDYAAIQKAVNAVRDRYNARPLYFPAGRYELSQPVFLDHFPSGGFWGAGQDKTVLVSTTGLGVFKSDSIGYSTFVDIGFENKPGATTPTLDLGWDNRVSVLDSSMYITGAANQENMFYRVRFENGAKGLQIGRGIPEMGSEYLIVDSIFRNVSTGISTENYNSLTDTIVNSKFQNVGTGILVNRGSINSYGNSFTGLTKAAHYFSSMVGDGIIMSDSTIDSSTGMLFDTGHAQANNNMIVDRANLAPTTAGVYGFQYKFGGSVSVFNSNFNGRKMVMVGTIGDSTLLANRADSPNVVIANSNREYPYYYSPSYTTPQIFSANAGADKRIYLPQVSTTLTGGHTSGGSGATVRYEWSALTSTATIQSPTTASTQITTPKIVGPYYFLLKAIDSYGTTVTDTVTVSTMQSLLCRLNLSLSTCLLYQ
jgi:hypothetical protein